MILETAVLIVGIVVVIGLFAVICITIGLFGMNLFFSSRGIK